MPRGRRKGSYTMTEEHKAALAAARSAETKTKFTVGRSWRVLSVDERNWTLQKASGTSEDGETIWISKYFYNTLSELLRNIAKKCINNELKGISNVDTLVELAARIEDAENRVLAEIKADVPEELRSLVA